MQIARILRAKEQKCGSLFSKSNLLSTVFFKQWERMPSFEKSETNDDKRSALFFGHKRGKYGEKNEFEENHC